MKTKRPTPTVADTETLEGHINQDGVRPGVKKLAQFRRALQYRGVPPLYHQEGKGFDAIAYVKWFDPAGGYTYYVTEWDGTNEVFGLVTGLQANELGYTNITEVAFLPGRLGIGIEIDVHFLPQSLKECRRK